jgi:predicted RNA-binding Zn-ribbon protein involved in translation (DUF1610 family)
MNLDITVNPFAEIATCPKCGMGDRASEMPQQLSAMPAPAMLGTIVFVLTRYCAGAAPGSTGVNLCAGIGHEHLHKICPNCGYEWLTKTKDGAA